MAINRHLALHRLRDRCDALCAVIFRPVQCLQVLDPTESQEPLHDYFLPIGRDIDTWANNRGHNLCVAYDPGNEYHWRQRHFGAIYQLKHRLDSERLDWLAFCGYHVPDRSVAQTHSESRHRHL